LASAEETKPNMTKANIHPEHKSTTTQNKHTKLKPGLITSYDLRPGNEQVLFYSSRGLYGAVGQRLHGSTLVKEGL